MLKNIFGKKNSVPQKSETIALEIEGMTCESCSAHIGKDMNGSEGIISCFVDHKTGKGEFTFDTGKLDKWAVVNAVNGIGKYKVKTGTKTEDCCVTGNEDLVSTTISKVNISNDYDLIIIGGGSAAFSAAIKAESLGLSTLMINGGLDFGGTCVNVGCVPSKNLIRAGESAYNATHSNFEGIKPKGVEIDFAQIIKDKKKMVATLQEKKYMDVVSDFENLTLLTGWATFKDNTTIEVDGKEYQALKFLIATGATTNIPDIEGLSTINYLTNVTLFELEEKPDSITIMGAGYIGLEIAMAYNRLGVKVRIIEFTDRVLRTQTTDVSEALEFQMRKEGIEILPNFRAVKFEQKGVETIIDCKRSDGSYARIVEKGKVVIATGTKPNTSQ